VEEGRRSENQTILDRRSLGKARLWPPDLHPRLWERIVATQTVLGGERVKPHRPDEAAGAEAAVVAAVAPLVLERPARIKARMEEMTPRRQRVLAGAAGDGKLLSKTVEL
jgi:hypothetical protein